MRGDALTKGTNALSKAKKKAIAQAKRAATVLTRSKGRDAVGLLSSRDRPNEEYFRHHSVVSRAAGIGGMRVKTRLEQMLTAGDITPPESEAGWRFGRDWLISGFTSTGSSLSFFDVKSSGDPVPNEGRLDAARNHRLASLALLRPRRDQFDKIPVQTMVAFTVEDRAIADIAADMASTWRTAKRRIIKNLQILVEHYDEVDGATRKSATLHTKEAALRRFDPDDRRNPFTGPQSR